MALQAPVDRAYLNLLSHLREDKPRIPLETLHVAIRHYLVHLPSTHPTPTPLAASVIASPAWLSLALKTCLALGNTFRAAVRDIWTELKKRKRGLFDTSPSSDFSTWARGILAGIKDGDVLLRLAISGGLRLGLGDLRDVKLGQRLVRDVEEMMVLAFAEIMEETASARDRWAAEFKKDDRKVAERTDLAVLLASHYFNSISTDALTALNLLSVASSYLAVIEKGFASGSYLHAARDSLPQGAKGPRSITKTSNSPLERSIDPLLALESFTCMAYLCRLLARIVTALSDTSFRARKRRDLWDLLYGIAQSVYDMSARVEDDWRLSPLVDVVSDAQLDERTKNLTKKIWTILMTQLFSTLMLQQAILVTILFHPAPSSPSESPKSYSTVHLMSTILQTLSSLSFVIASFGGVTAGPADTGGKGPPFPELKKVFYMAIDILSTDVPASEAFVRSLIRDADTCSGDKNATTSIRSPFVNAKRSFALSCLEQFIPVLEDSCIEEVVVPFCEPHLNDPSDRQSYEAAHSVMLSIFAAHAEKSASSTLTPSHSPQQQDEREDRKAKGTAVQRASGPGSNDVSLARRLVPGYAQILLENAKEGGLTTAQLRLAYSALVRSASTGRNAYRSYSHAGKSAPGAGVGADEQFAGDPALVWLCVEELLRALTTSSADSQIRFGLSLTLISLISNVGLQLLPRLVEEVERVIEEEGEKGRRKVLIENVFEEILERIGDREREFAMRWWFDRAKKWESCFDVDLDKSTVEPVQEAKL